VKYQLVLQWSPLSDADYDRWLVLEETMSHGLGDVGIVDGHDIGSGEMNIFIHTDEPKRSFERAMALLRRSDLPAGAFSILSQIDLI
jgi:hypothetical protein